MINSSELGIDHEVRIRTLEILAINVEKKFDLIDRKFDKIEQKMDSQFHWVLGSIFTMVLAMMTIFGGIILHMAKLI